MRRLCERGFAKTVVTRIDYCGKETQVILFEDYSEAAAEQQIMKVVPALPPMLEKRAHTTIRHRLQAKPGTSTHRVSLPLPVVELEDILGSSKDILRQETDHLPLSPEQISEIHNHSRKAAVDDYSCFDRLLIFVDGSSDPAHKHHHTTFVNECGRSDSWAFAVLGETYGQEEGDPNSLQFLGWTSQTICYEPEAPCFTGVTHIGADVAEREALIWAGLWRMSINTNVPTSFCFDSTAAGCFADGTFGSMHPTAQHRLLRGIYQALEAMLGFGGCQMHHVHGHCGLLWNELVDAAAKYNGQHVCYNPRQKNDLRKWGPMLQHLWMVFTDVGVPLLREDGFDVSPPDLPPEVRSTAQSFPTTQACTPGKPGEVYASFATANVRTLGKGPDSYRGKVDYLQQQFAAHGLVIIGLQETRTEEGLIRGKRQPFLRYCSGHERGHHGVELWLSTVQPFGYQGKTPIFLSAGNVIVLHKDPRRLLARIETALGTIYVAVLHGPQSGIEDSQREQWWNETTRLCQDCDTERLFLLCDANAASGPKDGIAIFDNDDDTTPNTPYFRSTLTDLALCLPSTGPEHYGINATWTSPDMKTARRIDYVCVPQVRATNVMYSTVLQEIDFGNGDSDHLPAGVQLWWPGEPSQGVKSKGGPKFDRAKLRGLSAQKVKQDLLARSRWHQDIESQVDLFNHSAHELLTVSCPNDVQQAKKPFFDQKLWELRGKKLSSRRNVKKISGRNRREILAYVFLTWKQLHTDEENIDQPAAWNYRSSVLTWLLKATAGLYSNNRQLRQAVIESKDRFVRSHIDSLQPNASASEILHGLRPVVGSSNQRKRKGASLPLVLDAEGKNCRSTKEATDRWIEFFGAMEGGTRLTEQQQRDLWRKGLADAIAMETDIPLSEVPTLFDLECAYRHVRTDKATGHDHIPGELCHHFPTPVAAATYGQLLHLFFHGQEALIHKGGKLVTSYKKGRRDCCESYRSLLISSHVGKSLHRTLRQTQCSLYASYMQTQQLGGRKRTPVGFALHMCRAFQRVQQQRHHCCGFLFLDLTEAYYRVLRPLVLGGEWSDEVIARMAARLQLGEDALHDLYTSTLPNHTPWTELASRSTISDTYGPYTKTHSFTWMVNWMLAGLRLEAARETVSPMLFSVTFGLGFFVCWRVTWRSLVSLQQSPESRRTAYKDTFARSVDLSWDPRGVMTSALHARQRQPSHLSGSWVPQRAACSMLVKDWPWHQTLSQERRKSLCAWLAMEVEKLAASISVWTMEDGWMWSAIIVQCGYTSRARTNTLEVFYTTKETNGQRQGAELRWATIPLPRIDAWSCATRPLH